MEMREAVQRIFRVRGLVILAVLVGGIAAGYAAHREFEKTTYTASARLILGGSVPQDASWAEALAGTVEGIVTSPDRISGALADAGATRDIIKFTRGVTTQPLSDSSVLELSVTDTNAGVAGAVANTLANGAVATLNTQQQQPSQLLLEQLQAQIDTLASEINGIDSRVANPGLSSPQMTALLAQRTDLSQQMTALITKSADFEQQVVQSVGASVIALAARPDVADPSRLLLDLILGALAGLILGVGLAVLLETLRPTLVGREAIERAIGAPVLGVTPEGMTEGGDVLALSLRLRRAAERARVSTVVLWNGEEDMSDVAQRLRAAKPAVVRAAGRPSFNVRTAVPGEPLTQRCGLVVVVPSTVPLRTIEKAEELHTGEGPLLLGVLIKPRRRRWPQRRQRAEARTERSTKQHPRPEEAAEEQPSAVLVS
jgi:capsular polysaccharide biosynthesis protein